MRERYRALLQGAENSEEEEEEEEGDERAEDEGFESTSGTVFATISR